MKTYLDIVRNVLDNGISKEPTRMVDGKAVKVENGTIGLPAQTFIHDMRTGFPALTTRKIAFRSTMVELEGFIKGITDKTWYQQRGCKFWDGWCNPQAARNFYNENYVIPNELARQEDIKNGIMHIEDPHIYPRFDTIKNQIQLFINDLGPIYGYQWRKFGKYYGQIPLEDQWSQSNGALEGHDQLKSIVNSLKKNPYDRRMVCSAWNPNQIDMMALPPCHFAWNVVVYGDTISLIWHQRSCDLMCGVSHNIASYAALLCLLGKTAGLTPWMLKGDLNDCHIYTNQIENAKEQLSREPKSLPTIDVLCDDIFEWDHTKIKLNNYNPHPKLKFEVTI